MEWNEETIGQLRLFWDEGHSTAEIGRRLGITKNAVVGKAHRLNLVARPSPIRRASTDDKAARPASPRRVSGPTLPPLAAPPAAAPAPPIAPPTAAAFVPPAPQPQEPARPMPVLRAVPPAPRPAPRTPACCWPIGEPGTPSFRFCNDPALGGKPYCAPHAAIAYVKVRDRREDAA